MLFSVKGIMESCLKTGTVSRPESCMSRYSMVNERLLTFSETLLSYKCKGMVSGCPLKLLPTSKSYHYLPCYLIYFSQL